MIRQLITICSVFCGKNTCVGRDSESQWILCKNYCNMGRFQGKCEMFGVALNVRIFKKGIPIAQRALECKKAERCYKNFIQTYKMIDNKE